MSRSLVRLLVFVSIAAMGGVVAFGGPEEDSRSGFFNAGVATSAAAFAGSVTTDPAAVGEESPEGSRAVIASAHLASSVGACAKIANGQLRLADASGCLASEVPVSLAAGDVTPLEVSRVLEIPAGAGGMYNGIFGGLLCPANRTLVSSGFQVLRADVEIRESFIGPGFGLPRVAIVSAWKDDLTALPAGEVVRMWATCL